MYILFLSVLYACVLYFGICTFSARLSMFHMEKRSRNMLIIIIMCFWVVKQSKTNMCSWGNVSSGFFELVCCAFSHQVGTVGVELKTHSLSCTYRSWLNVVYSSHIAVLPSLHCLLHVLSVLLFLPFITVDKTLFASKITTMVGLKIHDYTLNSACEFALWIFKATTSKQGDYCQVNCSKFVITISVILTLFLYSVVSVCFGTLLFLF